MEHFPEFAANHLFLFALLISILLLLFWNLFGPALSGITLLNPQETTRMLNHEHAVLVDVRNEKDFADSHILGSHNIPAAMIGARQNELVKYKERPIILCSSNGNESLRAARLFKMQGFEKIYTLKGGLHSWRSANLPLTRDTASIDK
jgi:Rhodanese-related sulfurtransferase